MASVTEILQKSAEHGTLRHLRKEILYDEDTFRLPLQEGRGRHNEEKAKERIDMIPKKNPFKLKYEERPGKTEDWASCEAVLDKQDVKQQLLKGWK